MPTAHFNSPLIRSILVMGQFTWSHSESQFCQSLRRHGIHVHRFSVTPLLGPHPFIRKPQLRILAGPGRLIINIALLVTVARFRPQVLLIWRLPWPYIWSLRVIRLLGVKIISLYNNDDPFGPDRHRRPWRVYRRLVPHVDICFAYRPVNLVDHQRSGASRVFLLPPAFDPHLHTPPSLTPDDRQRLESDVVFAGHYEPDGRHTLIESLVDHGIHVRVFGSGWHNAPWASGRSPVGDIARADPSEYVRAIAASKIALVFLSSRNRDQYTRRCFEIPAIGTPMLAPRTPCLQSYFEEGKEALFYSTDQEAIALVKWLLAHDVERRRLARAGQRRANISGYDIDSRTAEFLAALETLLPTR